MDIRVITSHIVNVQITSNLNSFAAEKRFDKSLTIGDLKGRLEMITGGSAASMTLDVFDTKDQKVCSLNEDANLLGSYNVEENYRIHVTDAQTTVGEFEDVSKVEKFEISQDEYSKRNDSVRSYLKRNKLGKYNEDEQKRIEEENEAAEKEQEEKANTMQIGNRCQVQTSNAGTQRGEVKYIGETHFKPGFWIGVQYDEPVGKNNGSVEATCYFEAPDKYGAFVRPSSVTIGDFPEVIDDLDEM